jgi:hypothetical protein
VRNLIFIAVAHPITVAKGSGNKDLGKVGSQKPCQEVTTLTNTADLACETVNLARDAVDSARETVD